MIRYDFNGVETVLYCFMQTFGTTNTIKIDLFTLCTSLLGGHSYKTFNERSRATKTGLRPGNYPGLSRGGEGGGLFVKNLEENDNKKLTTQQLQNFTLNIRTFISFNFCLPVTARRLNSVLKVAG
jgi:hypothetical protein